MNEPAGRVCPIRYRYGPAAIAQSEARRAETLYVIGGLYGNLPALDAIESLAAGEPGPVTLCFNGDFNWFNVDDAGFREINERVLAHDLIVGNVEAEFVSASPDTGCGCAYPEWVDAGTVERSNRIHARLVACANRHPDLCGRLAEIPMFARYRVGELDLAVVHGDAESLAGWRFDASALDEPGGLEWLAEAGRKAGVDLFASSHTCLPAMRFATDTAGRRRAVLNNGAAGMPNFRDARHGVISRISATPSPYPPLYGSIIAGARVDAIAVHGNHEKWLNAFLANWPPESDAWLSYMQRIDSGPDWTVSQAVGRNTANARPHGTGPADGNGALQST